MNDEIYIDTLKEQINCGMYDHLFNYEFGPTRREPKRDLVFLDIGANIGLVSVYAVPYCNRIVAVEPSPWTFSKLRENVRNYSIIEPIEAALSDKDGVSKFFVNDINFTASSTVNTYGQEIAVNGVTLKSLLEMYHLSHVDVCKIDIEGEEGRALNYEQLSLATSIIDTFFIEMHNCPFTDWQHKLGTIVSYLSRLGYEKQEILGMGLTATKLK